MMIKKIISNLEKICGPIYPLAAGYKEIYRDVIINEINLGRITEKDCVLNIGCGAIPFTALLISEITGASVTAIDRDFSACQAAKKTVKSFKLDHLVSVVHGEASQYLFQYLWQPGCFDVAVIALQAEPKYKIIENLRGIVSRIILRVPSDPFLGQYDPIPTDLHILESVQQNMKTFNQSALVAAETAFSNYSNSR